MGVRGLTTYINCNQEAFLQKHFVHDCWLVIDGHSLCAQLYQRLNSFSAFGGDYDKFASYTRNFFKTLRKCNITSFVLFDGSSESRKLKTTFSRLRSKINGASRLDPVTQHSLQIFPLLLRDVFVEALIDMNIEYTVCEFEADDEIAAMARHLNCPVLSYDSDFFIYNVVYIPFKTLDTDLTVLVENDKRVNALECKIYRVEYMISHFGGLKEELLPLLATLLGNDYVEKRVFNKFFSHLKMPKSKKTKNDQQRCIHALFKWLQNESLESAIDKILGRLKKAHKNKVLAIIKKSIAGYNRKECLSLRYFNICSEGIQSESQNEKKVMPECSVITDNIDNSEINWDDDNESQSDDTSGSDDEDSDLILGLPSYIAECIRKNQIPKNYINLYTHHLYLCSPQAEDYNDNDSCLCTLPILRYAFDIMTDFTQEQCIYVSREIDCNYRKMIIDSEFATPRLFDEPFEELTDDQLKSCFHHFLRQNMELMDVSILDSLPANFQLIMISILWWVAKCNVPISNVHSLFISYIMLEVIDEKTGTFRGHNFFNNKYAKKLEELKKAYIHTVSELDNNKLYLNKNKVQYEDCLLAASLLLKHFELDNKIRRRPKTYDTRRMHSFAQFQCCLLHFNSLNTICRCPYVSTKYSKCFNGTFVYNIAVMLENQIDPVAFFEQYLKGATSVLVFYKSLCDVYKKCVDIMNLENVKDVKGKRRRRRKQTDDEEFNFIVKGFEAEVVI